MIPSMAKKSHKPGRARETGETVAITVELPADLNQAVETFMKETERTKRGTVVMALRALLEAEGYWPPKEGD